MSADIRANVYANCKQRGAKRSVMIALTDLMDGSGVAVFVHSTVATMTALEDDTVGACLRALRADGEIDYVRTATGPGSMSEVRMPRYGMADKAVERSAFIPDKADERSAIMGVMADPPTTHSGYSVHSSQPAKSPPTRDVFIPPPVSEDQEDSAANAARRQSRPPTAQQAMFGECADVIGVDLALIDDDTKTNLGKLAAAFIAEGVPLGMPTEAWATERRRIAGFADGRAISPPTVKRLRTLVGAYRKAKAEGAAEDLGPGRYRDPVTGRLVVDWRVAR